MSITKSIINIDEPSVGSDALVWHNADKTKFTEVDTTQVGKARETVFQRVDGSDEYPMTVRVGSYPAEGQKKSSNTSVRNSSWVKTEDSVTGEITYGECACVIALTMPGAHLIPDKADVMALAMNTMSWLIPLVDGNFSTAALEQLRFGATNGVKITDDPTA